MNVIEVIKSNPLAVSKALEALGAAAVTVYFTLAGHPDQSNSVVAQLESLVIPGSIAISAAVMVVQAAKSALHFSRGPVAPTATTPTPTTSTGTSNTVTVTLPVKNV